MIPYHETQSILNLLNNKGSIQWLKINVFTLAYICQQQKFINDVDHLLAETFNVHQVFSGVVRSGISHHFIKQGFEPYHGRQW